MTRLFSAEAQRWAVRTVCLGLLLLLGGCRGCPKSQPPIHLNPNMDSQPKYRAQAESAFFADGATMRTPVEGTVARGAMPMADPLHTGRQGDGFVVGIPLPVDAAVLTRGQQRYGIYCLPCHGDQANGRGMLYQRSQIQSADLHDPRIVAMPSGEIFDTMTNGLGLMPAYDYSIPVADRWAIIAYIRTLQGADGESLSVPNVVPNDGSPTGPDGGELTTDGEVAAPGSDGGNEGVSG
ncbi:MAG: cytochrome c [Thermoanaerobaculia bacterium]|nr:cytochrome c [Thermoanaerobaculia bacterium]